MSIKDEIIKIYLNNTDYKNPSQAVNQASSLSTLSSDLYTDSRRFIYELLQNADDSSIDGESVKVWIKVFDDNLVIAHTGKHFTVRDLQGICNINNGTKKSDLTKTGYKGIGFKSVFGQSNKVIVFSNNEYFRFDSNYSFDWNWTESKTSWEKKNDRLFEFPWQIIPIYTEENEVMEPIVEFINNIGATVATIIQLNNLNETIQAVQNLSEDLNMFLFLKNITKIIFDLSEYSSVEIKRSNNNQISLIKNQENFSKWLISTIRLAVPEDVKVTLLNEQNIPEKLINTEFIALTLAANLGVDGIKKVSDFDKVIYSYLPTDETRYSLPVLVNTSFVTSANRETLHINSKWNQWIFRSIAIEIFKWISELVSSEYSFQAYQLIPKKIIKNDLGVKFNEGIDYAIKNIPFVLSREGDLIRIEDAIVDFTHLSEKSFINADSIKNYILFKDKLIDFESKKFVINSNFFSEFKMLGASYFEWEHLKGFFTSIYFISTHKISENIELIKHFKKLCESNKISKNDLLNIPFIWDNKNCINFPNLLCLPTVEDDNWDNPNSDVSFLHRELQDWLQKDIESRIWLESLGVKEKTDVTYIIQTVLPNIDNYITKDNAIETIKKIFILYQKGDLKKDLINQLTSIQLLTKEESLLSANNCYLSNFYKPRLEIEEVIDKDIFVSELYCTSVLEKDEWKQFFKLLGVHEGISHIKYENKITISDLINKKFKNEYFETEDKSFNPLITVFTADSFSNIITLKYIHFLENNPKFAFKFWSDYIESYEPKYINETAIAYWGRQNKQGRINGNEINNYIPWFIKNIKSIPTVLGTCEKSSSVFINTEDIKSISGKYLPVFYGPNLSSDWKAFFGFKTQIKLSDYLNLLSKISKDIDESGYIRKENYNRIQSIYTRLLSQCTNWSTNDIKKVQEWANTGLLLNTKGQFTECSSLNYFLDGNEMIFQDQHFFILLSEENKKNPNIEFLLGYFNLELLTQNKFELRYNQIDACLSLIDHLKNIIPYFKMWIKNEDIGENVKDKIDELDEKLKSLEIFQTEELEIAYKKINFIKKVNIHFNENRLYVTQPWNSNSVLLKLSDILCRFFGLVGYDKKLDFLLRSTKSEILEYFKQEKILLPQEVLEYKPNQGEVLNIQKVNSFEDMVVAINEKNISPSFFHLSNSDFNRLIYIQKLISRSVKNIINHLKLIPGYDCSSHYKIADSIIGGITKNGNEITVVARPSDNDEVIIYYTSEFDVLEYVDAELWCEDGVNIPKQITLGQLLKKTSINRIPIKNNEIINFEIEELLIKLKSNIFEFNAVPYIPHKLAKVIASFANTDGGTLIFGLKEILPNKNEIVGLSNDFSVVDITKKAISLLMPMPEVSYNWDNINEKFVFIINVKKSNNEILLENKKYIREELDSILEETNADNKITLNVPKISKTIAIIIALENYAPRHKNQIRDVKYAINDALLFKNMLINSMKVSEEDIYMIINEYAMKSTLEYDLNRLFFSLTEEDRLIFYYVGHGFHNGISNFLSTYDMHQSNIAETSVSLRKILLDPLKKSKCKNALIFIDACAQIFIDDNERKQITNINEEELELLISDFKNYSIFLSCQPGQSSYSSDKLKNGIWTHHLVKAFNGEVPEVLRHNKYITDRLLNDYLSKNVSIYTKNELGYNQDPKAILETNYENVILNIINEE